MEAGDDIDEKLLSSSTSRQDLAGIPDPEAPITETTPSAGSPSSNTSPGGSKWGATRGSVAEDAKPSDEESPGSALERRSSNRWKPLLTRIKSGEAGSVSARIKDLAVVRSGEAEAHEHAGLGKPLTMEEEETLMADIGHTGGDPEHRSSAEEKHQEEDSDMDFTGVYRDSLVVDSLRLGDLDQPLDEVEHSNLKVRPPPFPSSPSVSLSPRTWTCAWHSTLLG